MVSSGDICVLTTLQRDTRVISWRPPRPHWPPRPPPHLPLKRTQPANTRGQRWHACRMSAALSSSSGSTWRPRHNTEVKPSSGCACWEVLRPCDITASANEPRVTLYLLVFYSEHVSVCYTTANCDTWCVTAFKSGGEAFLRWWSRWSSGSWRCGGARRSPTAGETGTEPNEPPASPGCESAQGNESDQTQDGSGQSEHKLRPQIPPLRVSAWRFNYSKN